MVKNYLRIAFRSLLKSKFFSFINIVGLAVGMAAFWTIARYVTYEWSYESFVPHAEDVYRVQLDVHRNGELVYQSSENYAGVGAAMVEEYPEVLQSARLYNMGSKNQVIMTWENGPNGPVVLKQPRFLYADPDFLPMFGYEPVKGNLEEALREPFKIAISETTARKYFGEEEPIGKMLRMQDDDFNDELCQVTAVFQDSPTNTHLKFDVLISFSTLYGRYSNREDGEARALARYKTGWNRKDYYTYIRLAPGSNTESLEAKFPALVARFKPDLEKEGGKDVMRLQPLTSIHGYSRLTDEPEIHGNGQAVNYLAMIAVFILIIAWINYINLSTAKSVERAREVGVRKVMGSLRQQLIFQFLIESMVINCIAIVLALLMVFFATPYIDGLGNLPETYVLWNMPWFWASVLLIWAVGSVIAGIYPAFVISSFRPIETLRGNMKTSTRGLALRRVLVVVQFAASVAMIIGTGIVYKQMNYMLNQDLGFEKEQIIVLDRPARQDTSYQVARNQYFSFKNGLENQAGIERVAGSYMVPGKKLRFKTGLRKLDQERSEATSFAWSGMDFDFAELMQFEMAAGRNFSREFQKDLDTALIINEAGARALGFSDPEEIIGQYVAIDQFRFKPQVVGVLKDFHQESLHEPIIPMMFTINDFGHEYYYVKISTNDIEDVLAKMETQWHASFAGNPFEYYFLDEYFNSYYQKERQFRDLFATFALLAIFIGCLGLFGLSSFTATQRTKEIGIRKVLGCSEGKIIALLSRQFLSLVLLANVVAWPVTYLLMRNWLNNFQYRTSIDLTIFLISGVLVMAIALITVSFHTIRSARTNPVNALKYE